MAAAWKVTGRCVQWRVSSLKSKPTASAFGQRPTCIILLNQSRPCHQSLGRNASPTLRPLLSKPVGPAFVSSTPIFTLTSTSLNLRRHSSSSATKALQTRSLSIHRYLHATPARPKDDKPALSTKPPSILTRLSPSALTPHENIYTVPNALTFSRLLSAPLIGYFILTHQPLYALISFFYAGVTDLLDGWLARLLNSHTVVGSVIDPMADKLLMSICVLALGYTGQFPWWLVVIIFGRDFALAISAIWWRWISLPPPKTMRRYWDFSLPSAEVHPTEISKINTLLQLLLVGSAMVLPVLPTAVVAAGNLQGVLEGWEFLVAGTTVWSGLSYIGNKDAVKVLSQEQREEKIGNEDKREG